MMTAEELKEHMAYCYGTEHYYRTQWSFVCTDGVMEFANNAEAFWFIGEVGAFLARRRDLMNEFLEIVLKVEDEKAEIIVKRDSRDVVSRKKIPFTDCPMGEWKFYHCDGVLMWNGEY